MEAARNWVIANLPHLPTAAAWARRGIDCVADTCPDPVHAYNSSGALVLALLQAVTGARMDPRTAVMVGLDGEGEGEVLYGYRHHAPDRPTALLSALADKGFTRLLVPAGMEGGFAAAATGRPIDVVGVHDVQELVHAALPGVLQLPVVLHTTKVTVARVAPPNVRVCSSDQRVAEMMPMMKVSYD